MFVDEATSNWLYKYLKPLKGCTIVETIVRCDEQGAWPVLVVQQPNAGAKFELEISRDEEGNGPGFVFGLPTPPPEAPKKAKKAKAKR